MAIDMNECLEEGGAALAWWAPAVTPTVRHRQKRARRIDMGSFWLSYLSYPNRSSLGWLQPD